MLLLNSFSLNMLSNLNLVFSSEEISIEKTKKILKKDFTSCVGHEDTASVFSSVLGMKVSMNRTSIILNAGDMAIIGQYIGPRLKEGETRLPEGALIKWVLLKIEPKQSLNYLLNLVLIEEQGVYKDWNNFEKQTEAILLAADCINCFSNATFMLGETIIVSGAKRGERRGSYDFPCGDRIFNHLNMVKKNKKIKIKKFKTFKGAIEFLKK